MRFFFIVFFVGLLFFGCENEASKKPVVENEKEVPNEKLVPFPYDLSEVEQIPADTMFSYWERVTKVDLFPHNLKYNISLPDTNAVRTFLKMIAPEPPVFNMDCQSKARIVFDAGKVSVANIDVFLEKEKGCNTIVFLKDNAPVFSNRLTYGGIDYFTKIFEQKVGQ